MKMHFTIKKSSLVLCLATSIALMGCSSSGSNDSEELEAAVVPEFTEDGTTDDNAPDQTESETLPGTVDAGAVLGGPNICSVEGINAWVDAQMRDYYIYFDQVPMVNLADYTDPSNLMADLRVSPDDFSSVSSLVQRENLFEAGETFGFGFAWRRDQQGALRFSDILSGSPMQDAGAQRGDRVLALNGIPELDITDNLFNEIFGERGESTTVSFTIERANEEARDIDVTSDVYIIDTVGEVGIFTSADGTKTGYLESGSFLRTTEAELDAAVAYFAQENINDLILDYRYNGGGFVFVAQKFAAQLAGSSFTGRAFQSTSFNSRYEQFNRTSQLEAQELNLDLPRVVILTTSRTASAAEAIANNLRPYLDVVLIGGTTRGKPFASVSNANCDLALNAMDRITSNEVGDTVLNGLEPTCEISDEFYFPRSDLNDALTGAAMNYIESGACPAPATITANLELRANVVTAPIDDYTDFDMPAVMLDR